MAQNCNLHYDSLNLEILAEFDGIICPKVMMHENNLIAQALLDPELEFDLGLMMAIIPNIMAPLYYK